MLTLLTMMTMAWISKHNHVRDAIFKAAVEAGPIREPDGLLPCSDDRPADVLLPIWSLDRGPGHRP